MGVARKALPTQGLSRDKPRRHNAASGAQGRAFEIDRAYRYTPDYLVRTTSERCGPGFLDQSERMACDEFVHEFSDGLPPGTYDLSVTSNAGAKAAKANVQAGAENVRLRLELDK